MQRSGAPLTSVWTLRSVRTGPGSRIVISVQNLIWGWGRGWGPGFFFRKKGEENLHFFHFFEIEKVKNVIKKIKENDQFLHFDTSKKVKKVKK